MISNETIKNRIRKGMAEKEMVITHIKFQGVSRINDRMTIKNITLSLDSLDGIGIDFFKMHLDEILLENGVDYSGILLEI